MPLEAYMRALAMTMRLMTTRLSGWTSAWTVASQECNCMDSPRARTGRSNWDATPVSSVGVRRPECGCRFWSSQMYSFQAITTVDAER